METVYFSLVTLVPAATLSRFFGESIRAKYEFKFYKFKSLLDVWNPHGIPNSLE